ncbi:hypothetical protein [Staphylococcus pseudoxylosus]|nr:hypothetical protein [Staphylococcus pseudoxylosus]MDW8544683.1 hypothetical protein [Staphylococcus pseudoxylosus]
MKKLNDSELLNISGGKRRRRKRINTIVSNLLQVLKGCATP